MMVFGRKLSPQEREAYDVLPYELAERVRVFQLRGFVGPFQGITLGRFIIVAQQVEPDGTCGLLAHELVHVRQWSELGVAGYLWKYFRFFGRGVRNERRWMAAYQQIDAEVEARRETDLWRQRCIAHDSEPT